MPTAVDAVSDEIVAVDKTDLAEWLGLSTPGLLGTGTVRLPLATADRLRTDRGECELTTTEVGLILGISRGQVIRYTSDPDRVIRLSYRYKLGPGTAVLISGAELAAFVEAKNTAGPMPTKAADRKRYIREVNKVVADACRRHNLPIPPTVST